MKNDNRKKFLDAMHRAEVAFAELRLYSLIRDFKPQIVTSKLVVFRDRVLELEGALDDYKKAVKKGA